MSNYKLCDAKILGRELSLLRGQFIARPKGDLEGHCGGTPIEALVTRSLAKSMPGRVFSPHEVINHVLAASPDIAKSQRHTLLGPPSAQHLLASKDKAAKWGLSKQCVRLQSDTADFMVFRQQQIVLEAGEFVFGDTKSVNLDKQRLSVKKWQGPNVIAALKLFEMASLALGEGSLDFTILYAAVAYSEVGTRLLIEDTRAVDLFKVDAPLYINWASSRQIQFDLFEVDQSFKGTKLEWCERYVDYFLSEWKRENARQARSWKKAALRATEAKLARLRAI